MKRRHKKKSSRDETPRTTERPETRANAGFSFVRLLLACFCIFPRMASHSETSYYRAMTSSSSNSSVSKTNTSVTGTSTSQTKSLSVRGTSRSHAEKTRGSGTMPSKAQTPSGSGTLQSHVKSSSVSHRTKMSSASGTSMPKISSVKEGSCEEEKPGSSVPAASASLSIERFTFLKELGRGSYGKVMLAMDTISKKLLALKFIEKSEGIRRPERTMVERNILKIAEGSDFLTHAYAAFKTKKYLVYVMEFVQGGTLKDFLMKSECWTHRMVRFIAAEIVCGLQFLHRRGIVHRDLKPDNILMDQTGHIKITDFGLAVEDMHGEDTRTGWAGTTGYMAPEMVNHDYYNASVDWWALGVIIYNIATGTMPFWSKDYDGLMKEIQQISFPDDFNPELKDLLKQLWMVDPVRRLELAQNIRSHPFFSTINWRKLELRLIPPTFHREPPEKICLKNQEKPVISSEEQETLLSQEHQELFRDFSFCGPVLEEQDRPVK